MTALAQTVQTIVRDATPDDLEWLIGELRDFAVFMDTRYPLFDEAYSRRTFPTLFADHVVLIAEREGERQGFVAGLLSPHPFNPALVILQELFWWVAAPHRHSRAGLLLLNALVEVGRAKAQWVLVSVEANSPVREATLLRRGFRLKERSYLLEV